VNRSHSFQQEGQQVAVSAASEQDMLFSLLGQSATTIVTIVTVTISVSGNLAGVAESVSRLLASFPRFLSSNCLYRALDK